MIILILSWGMAYAQEPLKKAFSEGIKASIKVIEYEKSQIFVPIPKGYCASIAGKEGQLSIWEEVKLESLALFFKLKPALFENDACKKVLCLTIAQSKEETLTRLKELTKLYPKLDEYITKVEILPTSSIHRVIPGVGEYFKDETEEIKKLKNKLKPDTTIEKDLGASIVLYKKKKIVFENNNTLVVDSEVPKVLFVQHKLFKSGL